MGKIIAVIFAFCLLAQADSIVTGTGYLGNTADSFSFTGGGLQAFSTLPDGPEAVGIVAIGSPVALSWACLTYPGLAYTQVSDGTYTDILTGLLRFSGTVLAPLGIQTNGTFTAPVSVVGTFQSFQDNSLGSGTWEQGPLLANINFSGNGLAIFQGCVLANNTFRIISASVDFQGTIASVPEPGTLLLLGTGLLAMGRKLWLARS